MTKQKSSRLFFSRITPLMLGLAVLVGWAGAQERTFFVGLSLNYSTLAGSNFDGEHNLAGPGQFIPMPKFKAALGYEAIAGVLKEDWGAEFTFSISPHKTEIFDPRDNVMGFAARNVSISSASLNFLGTPPLIKNIRGFFLLGVGISWFTVDNSFFEEDLYMHLYPPYPFKSVGDSVYRGLSLNLGGGIMVPLGSRFSISLGLKLQPVYFGGLKLIETSGEYWPFSIKVLGIGLGAFLRANIIL